MEALRQLIQSRLDDLGWSQSELARRSGVSQQTISSWMTSKRASGSRGPNRDSLRKVAIALGLSVREVFEAAGIYVPPALTPDEREVLLAIYAELDEADRAFGLEHLRLLLERKRRS